METFTLKMRAFLFVWGFFMLMLAACGTYAGVSSFIDYLSFPKTVIFSTGMIVLIFSFIIILPLCIAGLYSSIKGQRLPENKSVCFFRWFIGALIISIMFGFSFKLYYQHKLEEYEYIVCNGVPTGWMPGMATKYVIDESLCHQDR